MNRSYDSAETQNDTSETYADRAPSARTEVPPPLSGACGNAVRNRRGHAGRIRIASIDPASVGNGADVLALLAREVDEDFAADVAAARDAVTSEGPAWRAD